ncbi:MAG: hypothetical protein R2941_12825 [Desulfobacterales bacterium]
MAGSEMAGSAPLLPTLLLLLTVVWRIVFFVKKPDFLGLDSGFRRNDSEGE